MQGGGGIAGLKSSMRKPQMRWRRVAQALQTLLPRNRIKLGRRRWNGNEITIGHGNTQRIAHKNVALIRVLQKQPMVVARMTRSFYGVKFKARRGNYLPVANRKSLRLWSWPKIAVEALIHFAMHAATTRDQLCWIN